MKLFARWRNWLGRDRKPVMRLTISSKKPSEPFEVDKQLAEELDRTDQQLEVCNQCQYCDLIPDCPGIRHWETNDCGLDVWSGGQCGEFEPTPTEEEEG